MDESESAKNSNIIFNIDDWKFEERLSKEFESIGFFMSDHPINQYKEIFNDYKILSYNDFLKSKSNNQSNIAATLLKIKEKKNTRDLGTEMSM